MSVYPSALSALIALVTRRVQRLAEARFHQISTRGIGSMADKGDQRNDRRGDEIDAGTASIPQQCAELSNPTRDKHMSHLEQIRINPVHSRKR
ncbi:MAG: hypothetical protein P8Z76_07365 [Alphaproteobacteria bacterium]|jgi:hypothetical protein